MGDFALVICSEELKKEKGILAFLYSFRYAIADLLRGTAKKICLERVNLYEGINCHILKLPYSLNKLGSFKRKKQRRIGRQLSQACSKNGISDIILPQKIRQLDLFEYTGSMPYSGRYIYMSLIAYILKDIFCSKGIRLSDIDISLIHGEDYNELYSFIWFLSPMVKYLTVVTEEKELIKEELDRIRDNTGLSIRITSNLESGLKESDVIINLNNMTEYNYKARIKTKAIVINYKSPDICRILNENTVINGIEVSFPLHIRQKLGTNILDYYSMLEISEIILAHKIDICDKINTDTIDSDTMEHLSRAFEKDGFAVTGYTGRHNIIKREEIKISSTLGGEII